ncbi:hypothetical protein PIIN_09571 [Serendipita indica DSM 11827]|uniref:3'-5' exonuclease domain-containing protein n=1 Tax=Serendipita indica (strain DSM 11827) TaxID=1109443 RepID=G4TW88_SERID|nr:hypothetical protein PIIN_09571 [Serendipita indica DSM 11827]
MKISHQLCDNHESITSAIAKLSNANILFIDCEGKDLGSQGGTLSTLGLGIYNSPDGYYNSREGELTIYIVDVLAFQRPCSGSLDNKHANAQPDLLRSIFDLLASSVVLKIGFDLRMDASELLHGYGVRLTCVLDLQVADVVSRTEEDEVRSLQRLMGRFLPAQEILGNRELYKKVVKLNGLDGALMDQGIKTIPKKRVDHSRWMLRPLSERYVSYAAEDICLIYSLYTAIRDNGKVSLMDAVARSEGYIQYHASCRPSKDDIYQRHGLMPLDEHGDLDTKRTRLCAGCKRRLSSSQFPSLKSGVGIAYCFVCYAVNRRGKLREKRK